MQVQQSLQTPFGVTAFGSSIVRVSPDVASLKFGVWRLEQTPKVAFKSVHDGANSVREYLSTANISDVNAARITLTQSFKYVSGEQKFLGYIARISFHVILRELDRLEEVLTGVINAGANEISNADYQTSRLKELRAQARTQAIQAAREKAQIYCDAAGVSLGNVIHIEDVNPNDVSVSHGHVQEVQMEDDVPPQSVDPGSIVVSGAVLVGYKLG